jgi:hypothetical protein
MAATDSLSLFANEVIDEEWGRSNVFKFPVLITSKQASRDRRTLELCSGTLPADLLQNFKRRHDIEC